MELIVFIVYVLLNEIFKYVERKEWKDERQMLLDRIQARDLPELKACTEPKQEEKESKHYELL